MELSTLECRIEAIVAELAGCNGYRTIWLDTEGTLRLSEPEEEFEPLGWSYMATLMHPDSKAVSKAVEEGLRCQGESLAIQPVVSWKSTVVGIESALVPLSLS